MKKLKLSFVCLCILSLFSQYAFAEEVESKSEEAKVAEISDETIGSVNTKEEKTNESKSDEEETADFPKITDKPFVIFNEGVTYSHITRIIYQKDFNRSNFVWQNELIGAYFEVQSVNIKPVDSILRLAAYYPIYYSYNGMKQNAKQAILYGIDLFWGPIFQADMWKYVYINFALGPHFLYQLSDEYHHVELGIGTLLGVELPIAKRWTILTNGLFSLDYGNLGSNKDIQPYNLVYNFQVELGMRYSRKKPHKYSYIK